MSEATFLYCAPLLSTFSLATVRKPETFKNRPALPLICRQNPIPGERSKQQHREPPPLDMEETFPSKSYFYRHWALTRKWPSNIHVYLAHDGFQPNGGIQRGRIFWKITNSHYLLNYPQGYPWRVSLFADFFSLPTCFQVAESSLYIAREEAGFAMKRAA